MLQTYIIYLPPGHLTLTSMSSSKAVLAKETHHLHHHPQRAIILHFLSSKLSWWYHPTLAIHPDT